MGNNLYLDKQEFAKFLSEIPRLKLRKLNHDQVKLMFETLLYGGLRIGEVLQITPESLIGGRKIRLEFTKGGKKTCFCSIWEYRPTKLIKVDPDCPKCHGKGKYRFAVNVWIDNPSVYSDLIALAKTKKKGEKLFPIHRSGAWAYANQLLGTRTHTFRHTFLTWLLETNKLDIRDIKQKARHSSLSTTDRYIQNNPDLTQQKTEDLFNRIEPSE